MGLGAFKVDSVENKQLLEKFMAKAEVSLNLIMEKLCLGVEQVDTAEIPDSLLPTKDHAQMDELEEKIGADPVFKRALIRKLSTFGGVSANKNCSHNVHCPGACVNTLCSSNTRGSGRPPKNDSMCTSKFLV
ncbi:uncharacterized protein LOC129942235 [Eupeodes corollae]|uniref:uncharacterized protein LOC129942235 n=1 Tax=Eupeodes corollae TaxID=290404 RepID=UPI0024935868|nr:uncharacterized protein LOC129942235 [Eupeodes corollae]